MSLSGFTVYRYICICIIMVLLNASVLGTNISLSCLFLSGDTSVMDEEEDVDHPQSHQRQPRSGVEINSDFSTLNIPKEQFQSTINFEKLPDQLELLKQVGIAHQSLSGLYSDCC